MLNTIIEASKNFCIHQIRLPYEMHDNVTKTRTVIAYIDIESIDGNKHRVYIGATPSFAQRISTLLLEEDESDEDTLIDMTLETANLIIGSAKVLASQNESESYNMSTPHFEKIDIFDFKYDNAKVLKVEDDEMIIAIKEL
ncbi:chemotaxis protein CheX [Sulfurimonas sp.]|jgi:chemotaxis protein CheY-P-specific phosphatase CheC|uniref:chemotaxis protein CheX n=1 Tax=Sulfurimonas sp. TaxID=2022749 RepID=UPI002A366712|nr:chemotaxis protein CheX [Sulfurimonas sp.]MDY0123709.1 chemotaxis protein CheX [Sulfurimonas sp.]